MAIRVHTLAKEIGVKSKAVVEKCHAEGLADVKNHMSVLSAGLEATIREWFSAGEHVTTEEVADRVDLEKVKAKPRRRTKKAVQQEPEATEEQPPVETQVVEGEEGAQALPVGDAATAVAELSSETAEEQSAEVESAEKIAVAEEAELEPSMEGTTKAEKAPPADDAIDAPTEAAIAESEVQEELEQVQPAGPQHVPTPAVLRGPDVIRVERPERVSRPAPARQPAARAPREPEGVGIPSPTVPTRPSRKGKGGNKIDEESKTGKGKPRVHPRRGKVGDTVEKISEWRGRDLLERSQRLAAATDHPQLVRRAAPRHTKTDKLLLKPEKIQISEPILLKNFCATTGIPFSKMFPKLMELGIPATINQGITGEQAEMLGLAFEIEVEVVTKKSRYEELVEQFENRPRKNLKPRAPIVTFLGHVDHGKTSLLDRIRTSRVAAGEAGGITQHIGAYRYKVGGKDVTFIDTPGHEAFTALRARGAQITDIVVLVVAADDGVMPQTVEAISHAKAAGVPIVVALNKIDLPNTDVNKITGQLAEHELISAEWGGETDIIKTSATTGEGMEELVDHLSTLAELLDLQAEPTGPANGMVIEARQDPTRGPVISLMVQEGMLKIGDVIVAGRGCGRVRAIFDDKGKSLRKAEPATPVEVLGLDDVPDAGAKFYVVKDQQLAKEIAKEKRQEDRQTDWLTRPKVTLENIFEQVEAGETKQLNVIVRADTQGSVDVLRTKLNELSNDEVAVRILHGGTGGITEGDVLLADASSAIIIGFGVVPDDQARTRAQKLDIQIKTYTVIYHLLEELTQAVEGLLEPTYEQTTKGRAQVRQVFRITKLGSVAGCFVTEGMIERSAKIRIIRQNVIIREDSSLESLRRFKDDAREVRQGFECGIKIAGFADVKEGDIIEAYEVVEVARKLETAKS